MKYVYQDLVVIVLNIILANNKVVMIHDVSSVLFVIAYNIWKNIIQ